MGRQNRFVQPDTVRIPLSDGDYIDIKKELNAGEERRAYAQIVKNSRAGERAELDLERVGLARLVVYVVGWSFVDDRGPVAVSESAMLSLDVDTFKEMLDAIDAHDQAIEARRAERKNVLGGATTSASTSPSVAG